MIRNGNRNVQNSNQNNITYIINETPKEKWYFLKRLTKYINDITLFHNNISNCNDIIHLDDVQLLQMIQECTSQELKYGENEHWEINLNLLETQSKERYIF